MRLDDSWFTEACDECGTAFSLHQAHKIHDEQSDFQHIEVYETAKFGKLMVIDGYVMLTTLDNFIYHEMMSHPALFTATDPKHVLIIGGGDSGTLREVLKHAAVQHAVQVDIDERVTRVSEMFFPELCEANADPRAELLFEDGIKYVADAADSSFDVVIIDSTDPIGQAARLFSTEFYTDCQRILRDGGVMVAQSESPLCHLPLIKSMRGNMRDAGFSAVQTLHFPQPCYPTGWWSCTLAGKGIALDAFRYEAAAQRAFTTRYYSADGHRGAANLPFMQEALAD
jgi:spermidine synthase